MLALTSFTAEMTYSCWRLIVGNRWSLLPTWLLFVLVARPASGGAVADPLLPPALGAAAPEARRHRPAAVGVTPAGMRGAPRTLHRT